MDLITIIMYVIIALFTDMLFKGWANWVQLWKTQPVNRIIDLILTVIMLYLIRIVTINSDNILFILGAIVAFSIPFAFLTTAIDIYLAERKSNKDK
jgi:hypothetical protein